MKAHFKAEQGIFTPYQVGECVGIRYLSTDKVDVYPIIPILAADATLYTGTVVKVGRKGNLVLVEAEVPPELQ